MNFLDKLSDYDLFAYIPPGFMALAAVDYLFGTHLVLSGSWDVAKGFLIFFLAYVAGHLVASPSAAILERLIVRKVMKQPSVTLLEPKERSWLVRLLFSDYYTPLSESIRNRVLKKLELSNLSNARGEDVFMQAWSVAKRDEHATPRLASFINLYGFCRNVSFVSCTTAIILLVQVAFDRWLLGIAIGNQRFEVAVALAIVSFVLFQRYLKFHRLYGVEVFTSFAQS